MNFPGMSVKFNSDGTIKDLPLLAKFGNALCRCAQWWNNPWMFSAVAQWVVTSYAKRKKKSWQWPATKMEIFNYCTAQTCAEVLAILRQFGIPTQSLLLTMELWPDRRGIGVRESFLVPSTQAAMADDILRQFGDGVIVTTPKRGRGAKFTKAWGVPAKPRSWDEALTVAMFGFLERGAVSVIRAAQVDKQRKEAKLPKAADKQPATVGKRRRKTTKKQPAMKRLRKAIWRA